VTSVVERPSVILDVTFAPAWWRAHYGWDFGEAAWRDPITRTERDREMRRILWDRFGDVGLGGRDPAPRPSIEAYGHRFMAALYGCEIRYLPDQDPAAIPLPHAAERMAALHGVDLDASPIVQRALAEAHTLEARYGTCDGNINLGGPLNNAVSVFAEAILSACLAEPDLARRTLQVMARTLLAVYEQVTCRINRQAVGAPYAQGHIGNCPVCMLSPATYRAVVLPADLWWRRKFQQFGLHHCGLIHAYAEVYQALHPNSLDVGWGSDLAAVRRAFPHTPMSLMIEASAIAGKGPEEIDAIVAGVLRAAAPAALVTRLWVAEAGPEVADDTVRALVTASGRLQNVEQSPS
jgi:hypothetical protein